MQENTFFRHCAAARRMAYPLPRPGPCSLFYLQAGHPFMAAGPCDFICSLGLMHHPVQATPDAPSSASSFPCHNANAFSLLPEPQPAAPDLVPPLEIILVNDGSTDRTAPCPERVAALHQNITVITRDEMRV